MESVYQENDQGDTAPTRAGGEWSLRGFTKTPNAVLRDASLSMQARLVYIEVLSYAWGEKGFSFPGQTRIAEHMGISEKMVRQYLRELENAGLLTTRHRGQGKTNLYTPVIPEPSSSGSDRKSISGLGRKLASAKEDEAEEDEEEPSGGELRSAPQDHLQPSKEPAETPCPTSPAQDREPPETTHTASGERGSEVGLVRDAVKDLVRGVEAGGGSMLKDRKNRYAGEFGKLVKNEDVGAEELEKVVARITERWADIPLSASSALEDVRNGRDRNHGSATPQAGVDALRAHHKLSDLAWIAEDVDLAGDRPPTGKHYYALGSTDLERGDNLKRIQSVVKRAMREASEGSTDNAAARIASEGLEDAPEGSSTSGSTAVRERLPGAPRDEVLGSVLNDRSGWVHDEVVNYLAGGTTSRKITEFVAMAFGLTPTQELDDRIKTLLSEMEGVPA